MNDTSIDLIENYFTQEKIESVCFMLIGVVAISFALINLFIIKYALYKGLAYPFLLIGLIQVGVGSIIYVRSPKDIIRVEQMFHTTSQKIQTEEIPRMNAVIEKFAIYKWIEIALIALGVLLFFYNQKSSQAFWKGIGLGLIIQATLMLALDGLAENRSIKYTKQLLIICKI